jgi:hypothetical protein
VQRYVRQRLSSSLVLMVPRKTNEDLTTNRVYAGYGTSTLAYRYDDRLLWYLAIARLKHKRKCEFRFQT